MAGTSRGNATLTNGSCHQRSNTPSASFVLRDQRPQAGRSRSLRIPDTGIAMRRSRRHATARPVATSDAVAGHCRLASDIGRRSMGRWSAIVTAGCPDVNLAEHDRQHDSGDRHSPDGQHSTASRPPKGGHYSQTPPAPFRLVCDPRSARARGTPATARRRAPTRSRDRARIRQRMLWSVCHP